MKLLSQPSAMQNKGPAQAAIDNKAKIQKDLDFSFLDLSDITEILVEGNQLEPREVGLKKEKPKKNADGKYDTCVLRFNNNKLDEIKELFPTIQTLVVDPQVITWLDLSFNSLTIIDPCICDLTGLRILYLHRNLIEKLTEIDKLAGMPNLRKLSLHGNPVAGDKAYKPYVLTRIMNLTSFDMAGITGADRATARTLSKMSPPKKSRKPKPE